MASYKIGGKWYDPSVFEVGIQDVSSPDAGRDTLGRMHTEKIATKFTLKIEHWEIPIAEAREILNAMYVIKQDPVTHETAITPKNSFSVTFYNPLLNTNETRKFYSGDKSLPVRMWGVNGSNIPTKRAWYAKLTFNLIEI